jgi:hypothetical protein
MSEVESSSGDIVRHEQVLAAARALASWAYARQAIWKSAPPAAAASAEPLIPASEPVIPELPFDLRQTPLADWHALIARSAGLAARASTLATWVARLASSVARPAASVAPSVGRAVVRFAMAGALIAVIAGAIGGGRRAFDYWQHTPAKAAMATSETARPVKPAAVEAASGPRRLERHAPSAGTLASLELPKLPAGVDGWIKIVSPFTVTVFEHGQPLWLYDDTAKLSAGTHRLRFGNRQFGYESEQQIVVHPGGQTTVSVVPPPSTLTINAPSDSEVWIDGTAVASARVVDFPISLGMHDVVVKNSAGVERHFSLTVTPAPVMLNVDFSSGTN